VNFASVSDLAIRFWRNSDSVLFFCFFFYCGGFTLIAYNRIVGVMVSVLATRVVDHGFESKSGKTKDYKIDICCFFGKHPALRFAWNQDNVSEWSTVPIHRL
jgi:hypothetical protein